MLGPIPNLIYINDLPENTSSNVRLFADDETEATTRHAQYKDIELFEMTLCTLLNVIQITNLKEIWYTVTTHSLKQRHQQTTSALTYYIIFHGTRT